MEFVIFQMGMREIGSQEGGSDADGELYPPSVFDCACPQA